MPTGYTHDLEKKVAVLQALLANALQLHPEYESAVDDLLKTDNLMEHVLELNELWKNHPVSKHIDSVLHESLALKSFKSVVLKKPEYSIGVDNPGRSLQLPPNSSNNHIVNEGRASLPPEQAGRVANFNHNSYPIPPSQLQQPAVLHFTNGMPTSSEIYESNFVNDSSFFLNYDIFQFISDEIETSGGAENWEPVALQYHGLSSIISGFTNKAIQQNYKKKPNRKNPFRVGSIFNVSSFAITANLQDRIHLPREIFLFPPNARILVDHYFQIYHILLPMLDKINVKRQLHHLLQQQNGDTRQVDCNLVALVWAVVALGEASSNATGDPTSGLAYAKNAILALENSLTSTIETVQAMLILGLFYYQAGQWDYSWVLISSSSRMAIDVRLMRSASDEENSKYQASTTLNNISRQRTWATVYVVNTLLSARMGRSPVVRAADWPIPQIDTDGWEEWDSWESFHSSQPIRLNHGRFLSSFNQFIRIVSILNLAITSTINTSTGVVDDGVLGGKINFDDRRNPSSMTMANFEAKINDFVRNMPDFCRLKENGNPAPFLAIEGVKQLVWCVLVVRLSSLKGSNEGHETLIKTRNKQYTKAILVLRNIYRPEVVKSIKIYPFVDYFLIMALNFPQMMEFPSDHEKVMHCREMRNLLLQNADSSPAMRISLEISQQMNLDHLQFDTPKAQESPTIANLLNSPTQEKATLPQLQLIKIEEEKMGNLKELGIEDEEVESQARALLTGVNALSPPPVNKGYKENLATAVSSPGQFQRMNQGTQFPMANVAAPQPIHHQSLQLNQLMPTTPMPPMQHVQPIQPIQPNQSPLHPVPQKNFHFHQNQQWVPPGNNVAQVMDISKNKVHFPTGDATGQ